MKISGVTVSTGHLNWVWIEEGYEMKTEQELDFIDESIRGILPEHLWYQITITLNPWNKNHWIKERFFDPIYGASEEFKDNPRDVVDTFAITTNYLMNEFIDESFKAKMLALKERNPKRYKVAGLGEWGVSEGVIFEQFREEEFNHKMLLQRPGTTHFTGLDFGWTDPVALVAGIVDPDAMRIYIYDEIYKQKLSNRKLVALMRQKQLQNSIVVAESANPKDIEDLFDLGLRRIRPALKGKGSILGGIRNIQDYEVVVHPRCINFIVELENYIWDPEKADTPIDEFNHLMDAWRYGMESVRVAKPVSQKAMVFR
jgi:phage terminase large subunit